MRLPACGRGAVQSARCWLAALLALSLASTLLLGHTWLWSRSHVGSHEVHVEEVGEEKTGHISLPADLRQFLDSQLSQEDSHVSQEDQERPEKATGGLSDGVDWHLTAGRRGPGSVSPDNSALAVTGNTSSYVDTLVGARHPDSSVDTLVGARHPDSSVDTLVGARHPDSSVDALVGASHPDSSVDTLVGASHPDSSVDTLVGASHLDSSVDTLVSARHPDSSVDTLVGASHPDRHAETTDDHRRGTAAVVGAEVAALVDSPSQRPQRVGQGTTWMSSNDPTSLMSSSDPTSLVTLYHKLLQAERGSLFAADVFVRGTPAAVQQHLPLFESAFHKFKVKVTSQPQQELREHMVRGGNHSILLCLDTTGKGHNCVINDTLSSHWQINIIQELVSMIMSLEFLCVEADIQQHRASAAKGHGHWYGGQLSCSISSQLPGHCDTNWWWVVNISSGSVGQWGSGTGGQLMSCDSLRSLRYNLRSDEKIFVPLPRDLLTVDGMAPFVWQVEVLVTSLTPPRVYLHPEGIAWTGMHGRSHRKRVKNASLLDLEQLLTERGSKVKARQVMERLRVVLLEVIRSAAAGVTPGTRFCLKCFQQLEILVVFDSSLQPIVLQVLPRQYTEAPSSLSDYFLEQKVLDDLAAMLVSRESTSGDLLWALHDLGMTYVRNEMVCDAHEVVCLQEHDVKFLLDTRREQKAAQNWIRLFPSTVNHCKMKHSPANGGSETEANQQNIIEDLASKTEAHYLCPEHNKQQLDPAAPANRDCPDVSVGAGRGVHERPVNDRERPRLFRGACLPDNSSWPYLSAIHTYPYLQLYPEFSPLTTDYRAYVNYQTTLVHIRAVSKHCRAEVRLGSQRGINNRWVNFSLGLGDNTGHIVITGRGQDGRRVHNTYKLSVDRAPAGRVAGFDEHKGHYQVCSLKQDCSLAVWPTLTCGLQPVADVAEWAEFVHERANLPRCAHDTVSGEWMVPCDSCADESTCYWKQAIWQPQGCQEAILTSDEVKDCLAGKRILFLGDSTNRGILHYSIQRLNGSLFEWDKTHTIRIEPSLNEGRTVFAFAYYPQFWRRPEVRPDLDQTLQQLLNRTTQWSHRQTVLVLGGVHWLSKHHLDVVAETTRGGPSKWTVVVKGLGAGFHQPVPGVHPLTLGEQQELLRHNQALKEHGRGLGFSLVDTFGPTMSRFRDFRPGRCACHFHQVSAVPVPSKEKWGPAGAADSRSTKHHIEGDINAVYSEMVINRMCIHKGG